MALGQWAGRAGLVLALGGGVAGTGCHRACSSRITEARRDQCYFDQALARTPTDVDGVHADVGAIGDRMVRQAALLGWVRANRGRYDVSKVLPLCSLIEGVGQSACVRNVGSPHLQDRGLGQ